MAAVACGMMAVSANAANLLANGSFETGDLTGWTAANTGVYGVISGPSSGFYGVAADVSGAEDGTYYLADGTYGQTATYSQTFADTPGETYEFSVWYASNGGAPSDQFLSIDGVIQGENNPAIEAGWQTFSRTFVGTGLDTLTLGSRNDPNANFFDNVSVVAVPEPGTWALMLVGVGGLGVMLRRRDDSTAFTGD
jgi:hypothetical protein